jgi:hypothetical protein
MLSPRVRPQATATLTHNFVNQLGCLGDITWYNQLGRPYQWNWPEVGHRCHPLAKRQREALHKRPRNQAALFSRLLIHARFEDNAQVPYRSHHHRNGTWLRPAPRPLPTFRIGKNISAAGGHRNMSDVFCLGKKNQPIVAGNSVGALICLPFLDTSAIKKKLPLSQLFIPYYTRWEVSLPWISRVSSQSQQ